MPELDRPAPSARRHIRNPELHRDAILGAAAQAFAERGYHHATLRDIARRAGVTHGLVMRHFGSKEQLFLAAVPGTRDLAAVAAGPVSTLAERITAGYLQRMEAEAGSDPFVALLRSVAFSDDAAARLLVAMQNSSAEVYRGLLGDEALEAVVPFIASLLIGVTFSRYIVRAGALAEMDVESLRAHLERSIRSLLAAATTNRAER